MTLEGIQRQIDALNLKVSQILQVFSQLGAQTPEIVNRQPLEVVSHFPGPSLTQALSECIQSKADAGRRARYLTQFRSSLILMIRATGDRAVSQVTAPEVESWLNSHCKTTRTRLTYWTDAKTFFSWCIKRGYLHSNPCAAIDRPLCDEKAPGIHTPEEVEKLLEAARAQDRDVMRLLCIQYFAGLRPSEAARLTEADIGEEALKVSARSKSRKRRLVAIHSTLRAWLNQGGQLPVKNLTKRLRAVRKSAGLSWPHDVTRHSFASYHLAAFKNASETAHELGHHSQSMLYANYREVVSSKQAEAFWQILPKALPSPSESAGPSPAPEPVQRA
ncbi:MAG: hypothetical protein E6Q97_28915 [Desulfurellales bacterium]|nr:MAG: hypothetical protein E6Q97_28915 [Desulfurellales bacterium]